MDDEAPLVKQGGIKRQSRTTHRIDVKTPESKRYKEHCEGYIKILENIYNF